MLVYIEHLAKNYGFAQRRLPKIPCFDSVKTKDIAS